MSISIRKIFVQLNEKKTYYTTALGPGRKCVEINFGGILGESFPECVGHSKCPHFNGQPSSFCSVFGVGLVRTADGIFGMFVVSAGNRVPEFGIPNRTSQF